MKPYPSLEDAVDNPGAASSWSRNVIRGLLHEYIGIPLINQASGLGYRVGFEFGYSPVDVPPGIFEPTAPAKKLVVSSVTVVLAHGEANTPETRIELATAIRTDGVPFYSEIKRVAVLVRTQLSLLT